MDEDCQGRDDNTANKEKIWTTATAIEKERVRALQWTAVACCGTGEKMTTTEAKVEAAAIAGR